MRLNQLLLFFPLFLSSTLWAQENHISRLADKVEERKTYALIKAKSTDKNTFEDKEGFFIKLIPPQYATVLDTVKISPALNGNMDTSNYFIQSEIIVLRDPGLEWKEVKVSSMCRDDQRKPHIALCLLQTVPKYEMVHKKFYPFKNILDTTTTDYVIPAVYKIIERKELISEPRLEQFPLSKGRPSLKPGEKLLMVPAGKWHDWYEVVCPVNLSDGPNILELQKALKKKGYEIELTGNYDEQTKVVIQEFQRNSKLPQGELTQEVYNSLRIRSEKLIEIIN